MTKNTNDSAGEFYLDHPGCWMCDFLGRQQTIGTERHHIAGRGRRHDVRANYAALCGKCHRSIQSMKDAELVCLVLKRKYDTAHYETGLMCSLRGWSATWITEADVDRCERIMSIMREVK